MAVTPRGKRDPRERADLRRPRTTSDGGEGNGGGVRPSPDGEGQPWRVRFPARLVDATPRVVETCLQFGLSPALPERVVVSELALTFPPGSVTLIVGPSGSGKSSLLAEITRRIPTSRSVEHVRFPNDVAIVDGVAPAQPIEQAMRLLSGCSLGEPSLWIRRLSELSEGERFRARLARAISLHRRGGHRGPLLCDEFANHLHRRLARAMAFNVGKLARRLAMPMVLATTREDLIEDLRPDALVRLRNGNVHVEPHEAAADAASHCFSLRRRVRIERGSLRDYARFAAMHYRQRDNVGFIDRVFVMREEVGGDVIGIVLYGRPALELSLRNRVTGGRYTRKAELLNRELRVLKRLVVHPDVRGCGLGHLLVGKTLPLAGTRIVECLASMAAVNPVFDKAGMRRIGTLPAPKDRRVALVKLRAAGADPMQSDFADQVRRRPTVRRLVRDVVGAWHRSTSSLPEVRLQRHTATTLAQTFRQLAGARPVYFLWAKDEAGRALIERGMREQQDMMNGAA